MTYDNLDAELVNELINEGRASLRELGERLDVSVTTVSNHQNDLEETGVIESYTPVVDYSALGYDVTAVIQAQVDGQALKSVVEDLQSHDQITTVYEVTGEYDIIAIGRFTDTDDMNDQIKAVLNNDGVTNLNTSVTLNAAADHEQFAIPVEDDDEE